MQRSHGYLWVWPIMQCVVLLLMLSCRTTPAYRYIEGYPKIECKDPIIVEKLYTTDNNDAGCSQGKRYEARIKCGSHSMEIKAMYWACGNPETIEVRVDNKLFTVERTEIDSTGAGGIVVAGIVSERLYFFESGYSSIWALLLDDLRDRRKSFNWKTGEIEQ